jgi:hypothetical protein
MQPVPWLDIVGLFIFLAGFIIGLGAVTVIDLHGFLGRNSSYWTEATTRTHKVTKPLIWIGLLLVIIGGLITYREERLAGIPLYLSFRVSPFLLKREREGRSNELLPSSWQVKITISFIFSFLGWWSALFLLVWYLVIIR